MNDEIKKILEKINKQIEEHLKDGYAEDMMVVNELDVLQWRELLDYITNLQEEIEFLKLNNPEQNLEHFRIIKENKRKIDNLRAENEKLKEDYENAKYYVDKYARQLANEYKNTEYQCEEKEKYKSRCEKAIARIKLLGKFDGKCCTRTFKMMSADFNDLLNILNGGDKE